LSPAKRTAATLETVICGALKCPTTVQALPEVAEIDAAIDIIDEFEA
jgi:hypothetical protein